MQTVGIIRQYSIIKAVSVRVSQNASFPMGPPK